MEKVARAWRARRVFTNNQGDFKLSKARILSTIIHVKTDVDIDSILESKPKGFTNVAGYRGTGRKPVTRYVGSNWISTENNSGITQIVAKKGTQTIMLRRDSIEVLGTGNYEAAFLAVVKNSTASNSNDPKVFNKRQKLFCTVAAICNLVQEFNGLVSNKGQ